MQKLYLYMLYTHFSIFRSLTRSIYRVLLISLVAIFFLACMTTVHDFDHYHQNSVGTALPISSRNTSASNKNKKTDELLSLLENSSYKSLQKVVDTVLSHPTNLSSNDKLYLYLATNLLHILYPYTKEHFQKLQYSKNDSKDYARAKKYIECFEALTQNKYLYDMKKDDFLSIILPTLFIMKNEIPQLYKNDINERLEKAKRINLSSPLPHYLAGLFYEKEHMSYRAKEAYRKAIALDASFYPAIIKYAKLCNSWGNFNEAIEMLNLLPKEYADVDEVRLLTAFAHIGKKDANAAAPYIDNILSEQVEEGEALFERVRLLIAKHEYMKANSLLNIYTTRNKTDKNYLLLKMKIAKEWNKNENTAKQYAEQAYKYYPENFDVLTECATLLLDSAENATEGVIGGKTANDFIEAVVNIEKDNIKTIKLLLKRELKEEAWKAAIQSARNLVARNPSNENKSLLVKAYLGGEQYTDALEIASALYEAEGKVNNEVFFDYLKALYMAGKKGVLHKLINTNIEEAKGERRSMLYYYSALLQGKSSSNYLKFMRQALLTNPRNSEVLFAMYELYFERHDYRNAQFYLKQAISIEGKRNKKYLKLYEKLSELLGS